MGLKAEIDLSRVSISERITAVGGAVLLIGLLVKWYGISSTISVNGVDVHVNSTGFAVSGWHSLSTGRWVFLACGLLAILLALAKARGRELNVPFDPRIVLAGLGGLSTCWIALRVLIHPGDHLSVRAGILVGLAGAALVTFGAWQTFHEEGAGFSDLREPADERTGSSWSV